MKRYAEFLTTDLNHKKTKILGSDGTFILDARKKLDRQMLDASERMFQLRHIHSNIIGFRVMEGERFDDNNTLIYEWIRSGAFYK